MWVLSLQMEASSPLGTIIFNTMSPSSVQMSGRDSAGVREIQGQTNHCSFPMMKGTGSCEVPSA